jgi:hypothetical protein
MEDRRASVDEKRAMAELIEEENKIMMMDPSNMDDYTKEWWEYARWISWKGGGKWHWLV